MLKKIGLFIVFLMLISGIYHIYDWNYIQQEFYKEGDTLEEISLDDLSVGVYVSFYIDDYVNKEIYVEGDTEYEVYTLLIERKADERENTYIQVMVKDQDTKQKLEDKEQSEVYFQGQVIGAPYGGFKFNKDMFVGTDEVDYLDDDKLILNSAIMQTKLPDEGYKLYTGIVLVLLAFVGYRLIGGIKGCVPDVIIVSHKYDLHSIENGTQVHNIRNEWLCEKDNLKNLQTEQIKNNKVCNVMIAVFLAGVIMFFNASMLVMKLMAFMLIFFGIGGVWSKFINSSHKLAVYIAVKRGKRSIYVEMEKCKKNIEKLKTILDKKS